MRRRREEDEGGTASARRQTERERMGGVEEREKIERFPRRNVPLSICSFEFPVSEII